VTNRPPSALLPAALVLLAACPGDDDDSAFDDEGLFAVDDDDAGGTPIDPAASYGTECVEVEPNDPDLPLGRLVLPAPPWATATDCGDVEPAPDGLLRLRGRISDIVEGNWDGDNDTFRFRMVAAATPVAVLDWTPLQGDLDAQIRCGLDADPVRVFDGGLSTAAVPETAEAVMEIPAGAECWGFVSGFAGRVADYELRLE